MHSPSPGTLPVNANSASSSASIQLPAGRLQILLFQVFAAGVLIGLVAAGLLLLLVRRPDPPPIVLQPPPTPLPTATAIPTATPGPIVVFVSGAVVAPGLYTLSSDARAGDAIRTAGGLHQEADSALINQAERLWDGAQVHVPSIVEAQTGREPAPGVSGIPSILAPQNMPEQDGRININTASMDLLITLPGIGPARATAIIAGRPYTSVEDLDRVSGIGAKTIEQLRDLITIE